MEEYVQFIDWTFLQMLLEICLNHLYLTVFSIVVVPTVIVLARIDSIVRKPEPVTPLQYRTVEGQHLPPNYPNGWIPILDSSSIKPNQVQSVIAFGRELTVVRSSNSQVYVIDSYCPHLGANLSVCGTLHQNENNDNCIRCPFHGWSFSLENGVCSNIPYESEPVESAKLKVWRSHEINDIIFVWYHADGDEPNWQIEAVEQIQSGGLVFRCRTEHYANCHFQEIPENAADVAHLNEIHQDHFLLGSDLSWTRKFKNFSSLFSHHWTAKWNPSPEPTLHVANFDFVHCHKVFGHSFFEITSAGQIIGPFYVTIHFSSTLFGGFKALMILQVTPLGPLHNRITHRIYTENNILGWFISRFLMFGESRLLDRDVQIWNRKAFFSKPQFAKSERSIVKFRRWFNQFYSKRSIEW